MHTRSRRRVGWVYLTAALELAGMSACGGDAGGSEVDGGIQEAPPPSIPSGAPEVVVSEGTLQGIRVGALRTFLGIPYAKPPLGALRFAPPAPVDGWQGVKRVTEHGPSCPQNTSVVAAPGPQSEDCLSLNVYAPEPAAKLPVMVWIHGGGYVTGGSIQYDATRLAAEGPVIVVTLNYRLGALGFLAHDRLDAARGEEPSGNDGIRDQQLALRWVKRNIAAFGGDADNITLMGESAGSSSACIHLVSPRSTDLARRYVMESGVCVAGLPISTKEQAHDLGRDLATALCSGVDDELACLRAKPAAELVAWGVDRTSLGAGWNPVINAADPVLPAHPLARLEARLQNAGEILIGTNKSEWGVFALLSTAPVTSAATFNAAVERQFGTVSSAVEAHYAPTDPSASAAYVKVMTDAVFRCPTRALARLVSAQGTKVYLYSFEQGMSWHGDEIPYVFGSATVLAPATPVEPLRQAMQTYWRSFAKDGDPNGEGMLAWPAYEASSDLHLTLGASSELSQGLSSADCDFWDQLAGGGPIPGPRF